MRETGEAPKWDAAEEADALTCDPPRDGCRSPKKDEDGGREKRAATPAPVEEHRQRFADPGALGFLTYGFTTVLYNLSNSGLCPLNTTTAGMVIAYGGFTQMLAGIMDFFRGNAFPCTIATTFGAFWIATALVWLLPRKTAATPDEYLVEADEAFMGAFFFLWAVLTIVALVSSFRQPLAISFVFFMTLLFFTLQSAAFWSKSSVMKRVAGYEGICCGLSAMYCGLAMMLNEAHGKTLLPMFPHRRGRIYW
ncbi:GPR1/FUN34/yaaH family protein [Trypanosoma conorhini]|uniref:GPR1/FUN34/yaaH family protein n=1 Tax=Trypanosoma conorhini TaxID=83891 RepID=A0A3R7MWG7_9TRYP|nr:GPR1/FUN34/yaaH family protein [Trypanosoma conorhini]RNF12382.1 GPR1/FUN34/yaaH family protein [Trypanosoma conorhini]